MLLYLNACVRADSRTKRLADRLVFLRGKPMIELRLAELSLPAVDEAFLQERDRLLAEGRTDDPMFSLARMFADAEEIVIAAPYWDLSFPAALKSYLEQINVVGVTFRYTPEGVPEGLCRARHLYYVTTAGGDFVPEQFGFGYVQALAQNFYGIQDVNLICAAGLDLVGADPEQILKESEDEISFRYRLKTRGEIHVREIDVSDFDGMRVDMNYILCCPSVHAVVQKEELIMGMGGDIRARSEGFPQDKADLLAKWVALHRNEIMENHQRANDGRPMRWIPPLNE